MAQHFGICEWSFPVSGPLAIQLAGEAGYEGIQLGEAGGQSMGYPLRHPRVQESLLQASAQWGVKLHSLNLGALLASGNLNYSANTPRGESARKSLAIGFDVCKKLGICSAVITVEPPDEDAYQNVCEHLKAALRMAESTEVVVETAQPLPEILRLLKDMNGAVKLCMDMLNPIRFGSGDPREQIQAVGISQISHFHLKDSVRSLFHKGERGCCLLGEGDAGYQESVDLIRATGFQGWMISENYYYLPPMNNGDEDFLSLAKHDLMTMRHTFK